MGRKASFLWRTLNWLSFLRRAPVVVDEGLSGKDTRFSGLDRGTDKVCSQTRKLDARANLARHSQLVFFHSLIRLLLPVFTKRQPRKAMGTFQLMTHKFGSWWHTFALNWLKRLHLRVLRSILYTRSLLVTSGTGPNPWTRAQKPMGQAYYSITNNPIMK